MYFATFYQPSAIQPDKLIEACGDRAIIILDGREHAATHHSISAAECKKRGYKAYQLHKGRINGPCVSSTIYRVGA